MNNSILHSTIVRLILTCLSVLLVRITPVHALDNFGITPAGQLYNFWGGMTSCVGMGDLLYVSTGISGLQVLDFSDPENVRIIGRCEVAATSWLVMSGDYLFGYDDQTNRLLTIDVSDPTRPTVVSSLGTGNSSPYSPLLYDTLLCYNTRSNNGGLIYYNISDPTNPLRLPASNFNQEYSQMIIDGQRMFLVQGSYGLYAYDFTDPYNLQRTSGYRYDYAPLNGINLYQGRIYSASSRGMMSFDISDPDSIFPADSLRFEGRNEWMMMNGVGYFPGGDEVRIVDLRNQAQMNLIEPVAADIISSAKIYPAGDCFYIAGRTIDNFTQIGYSVQRFTTGNPLVPEPAGSYVSIGNILDVAAYGDYLFAAADFLGVRIVDASDPMNPVEIDTLAVGNRAQSIEIVDGMLLVTDYDFHHHFFDLSEPTEPRPLGTIIWDVVIDPLGMYGDVFIGIADGDVLFFDMAEFEHPHLIDNYHENLVAIDGVLQDDRIILSDSRRGLTILDIRDISNIRQVEVNDPDVPDMVLAIGNLVACLHRNPESSLSFYDISNPEDVIEVGRLSPFWMHTAEMRDSLILYADYGGHAGVIDFSDPSIPQRVGYYATPGNALSATFINAELTAVADQTNLSLYDISAVRNAPLWVEYPDSSVTVTEMDTFRIHVVAQDRNNQRLTLTMNRARLPEQAVFTDNGDGSGDFLWPTTVPNYGDYYLVFIADNGETRSYLSVSLNVEWHPIPPTFTDFPADTVSVISGDTLNLIVQGSDPHNWTPVFEINRAGLPGRASFYDRRNGSCRIYWTPTIVDTGTYLPWIKISCNGAIDSSQLILSVKPSPPLRFIDPPQDTVRLFAGDTLNLVMRGVDSSGRIPSFSISRRHLSERTTFTDQHDGSCRLLWATRANDVGDWSALIMIAGSGRRDTLKLNIAVVPAPPPRFTDYPADTLVILARSRFDLTIRGEDPRGGIPSFRMNRGNLPLAARFTDSHDGSCRLLWTTNSSDTGYYYPWIKITGHGLTDSVRLTVVVVKQLGVDAEELPDEFCLSQAYPNPFNSRAKVNFGVRGSKPIELGLYDMKGRRVAKLYSGVSTGKWQTAEISGQDLCSGVYYIRLSSSDGVSVHKVALLR